MNNHPADDFIRALSTTIKDYRTKEGASRELDDLLEVTSHMVAALGALRSHQVSASRSSSSPIGT